MQKIATYIFNLSTKKLAVYLVLYPLTLFLAYTIVTITFRTISQDFSSNQITTAMPLGVFAMLFYAFVLLWIFWLRSAIYAVPKAAIGLPRKWFQLAYGFLWIFIVFNAVILLIETYLKDTGWREHLHLIHASGEFIDYGGIIISYPIICHYAARATMVKKSNEKASFISAAPFTLLLIFGTVLAIPFMHKYFSNKGADSSEVLKIYAMGLGLFMVTLSIGFIAAITGVV